MDIQNTHNRFKDGQYIVFVDQLGPQSVKLIIKDSKSMLQYTNPLITLKNIKASTLIKALQNVSPEINYNIQQQHATSTLVPSSQKIQQNSILKLTIKVTSHFLMDIQEQIILSEVSEIRGDDFLKESIAYLSGKVKQMQLRKQQSNGVVCNKNYLKQIHYQGSTNYETIASLKLKTGRHLVTFSTLAKMGTNGMYFYLGNGQSMIHGNGFYTPTHSTFVPITIQKVFLISNEQQIINITTYYSSSCPITLKNTILSAQQLN